MTLPIFDPDDPSVALLWGTKLGNVHSPEKCQGQVCVMHNPSDHCMRGFPLHWRGDGSVMERICMHGVGHPDPDALAFRDPDGWRGMGIHGCDGCCRQ